MQTLLWAVFIYCITSPICAAILTWDYKTRIAKNPKYASGNMTTLFAAIPVLNIYITFTALRLQWQMRRLKRKRRRLANELREKAEDHAQKGNQGICDSFRKLADQIENYE